MIHYARIVAATVVLGALGCSGDPGGNGDQGIPLDMLTSVANTTNQNLPTMLDDSTELTNVLAVAGGLVYRHRFVGAGCDVDPRDVSRLCRSHGPVNWPGTQTAKACP